MGCVSLYDFQVNQCPILNFVNDIEVSKGIDSQISLTPIFTIRAGFRYRQMVNEFSPDGRRNYQTKVGSIDLRMCAISFGSGQPVVQSTPLAPHLMVAFGEQRERFSRASDVQMLSGIAPLSECNGQKQ